MHTLANPMEGDAVKWIHLNEGMSAFLKPMMLSKKSTESIHKTEARKLF
jgi:hypothetical protein